MNVGYDMLFGIFTPRTCDILNVEVENKVAEVLYGVDGTKVDCPYLGTHPSRGTPIKDTLQLAPCR
jgi:hypothetical protein